MTDTWISQIVAITLFTENLEDTTAFYRRVFELPTIFEGDTSAVFKFGGTMINLLKVSQSEELIHPARTAHPESGARAVYTLQVDDVDRTCADLAAKGVSLLNGPLDRPWGLRTASFQDPAGNIWEIAH